MPSVRSSGKPKRPRLVIRRIVGRSMSPRLEPGRLIIASSLFRHIHPGQVYIFKREGKEMIKRVERLEKDKAFFIGDNLGASSDSRHFGWVETKEVIARVIWPRIHN